ncbi:unnamed protein product [Toxocara canis]|uniref:GIIM domain-containing protein n=1 Tax=Toxocara canis TaxID=6265 RepID=A0A183VFW1_TOXCA|nr:unnamed protein product [Toxocara canis]
MRLLDRTVDRIAYYACAPISLRCNHVIEKRYSELKKYVWRRIDPARRLGILRVRGHGIGRRGGSGGHGYTAHGALPQCLLH